MQKSSGINDQGNNNEYDYAIFLEKKGLLPGPGKCQCQSEEFIIQKDCTDKTSGCIFRCRNNKCRKKFSVRINSLFELFLYNTLNLITSIIYCFICLEYNVHKALDYLFYCFKESGFKGI